MKFTSYTNQSDARRQRSTMMVPSVYGFLHSPKICLDRNSCVIIVKEDKEGMIVCSHRRWVRVCGVSSNSFKYYVNDS